MVPVRFGGITLSNKWFSFNTTNVKSDSSTWILLHFVFLWLHSPQTFDNWFVRRVELHNLLEHFPVNLQWRILCLSLQSHLDPKDWLIIPDLPVMSLSETIIYFLSYRLSEVHSGTQQWLWSEVSFCSFPFRRCLHNIHIFLISVSQIAGIRADIHAVILSVGHFWFV